MPNLSEEERLAILLELAETPEELLAKAKTAAALHAEDEDDQKLAYLVYTYYFSRPENEAALNEVLGILD